MTSGAADQSYSFVQVSSRITSKAGLAQFEAARFVRDLAHKHHSTQLAQLAARITSVANSNSKDLGAARASGGSKGGFSKKGGLALLVFSLCNRKR